PDLLRLPRPAVGRSVGGPEDGRRRRMGRRRDPADHRRGLAELPVGEAGRPGGAAPRPAPRPLVRQGVRRLQRHAQETLRQGTHSTKPVPNDQLAPHRPAPPLEPITVDVSGRTGAACADRVEQQLDPHAGVNDTYTYAAYRAVIAGEVSAQQAVEAIRGAGYDATVQDAQNDEWSRRSNEARLTGLRRRLIVAALLTVPLMDVTIALALVEA